MKIIIKIKIKKMIGTKQEFLLTLKRRKKISCSFPPYIYIYLSLLNLRSLVYNKHNINDNLCCCRFQSPRILRFG